MTTHYYNGNPNCYTHYPAPLTEPVIYRAPNPKPSAVVSVPDPPKVDSGLLSYVEAFNPFKSSFGAIPFRVEEPEEK